MSDFKKYLNTYKFDCILPGSGKKVHFKPITTAQMKSLLVYEKENDPKVLENAMDELISSCVLDEDFDIKKQYIQDRFFLLLEIRKKTKGETYKFRIDCPQCKSQSLNVVDLGKLNVKKLDKRKSKRVKLNDNITIELNHLTREMQDDAYERTQPKEDDTKSLTEFMIATYANSIVKIITPDGEIEDPEYDDRIYLLENITQGEYTKITEWFDENDFGVDFMFKMKCQHCSHETETEIPSTDFFF